MQVDDEITYIMCVWDYVDVQGHTCRQANEEGQQQSSDGPHHAMRCTNAARKQEKKVTTKKLGHKLACLRYLGQK